MRRFPAIVSLGLLATLALAVPAHAEPPPFVDQYQEPIPWAGGDQHTGGNGGGDRNDGGSPLPNSLLAGLHDEVDPEVAAALETVATSTDLGAPPAKASGDKKAGSGASAGEESDAASDGASADGGLASDVITATAEDGGSYLPVLLLAIAGITLVAAAAALYGRRRRASE